MVRIQNFCFVGYGFGSLIWIPIQTAYVNPENVKAELDPQCDANAEEADIDCKNLYYRDPELLSRIPWMFFILGKNEVFFNKNAHRKIICYFCAEIIIIYIS